MKKYFLALTFFLCVVLDPQISKAGVTINGEHLNYQNLNLVVKTFDGGEFDLQKNHGKVVVVNFWAYWCTVCAHEMRVLEELHKKYHSRGLEIIGVSVDQKREQQKSLERIKNITYQNAMLVDATLNNFSQISSLPTTYIFNKNGILAAIVTGSNQQDGGVLEREILRLLN